MGFRNEKEIVTIRNDQKKKTVEAEMMKLPRGKKKKKSRKTREPSKSTSITKRNLETRQRST